MLYEVITPGGETADIIFLLVLLFILGFFLEWIEISYIVLPLFLPVFAHSNVNYVRITSYNVC